MKVKIALLGALLLLFGACGTSGDPATSPAESVESDAVVSASTSEDTNSDGDADSETESASESGDNADDDTPKTLDEYLGGAAGVVRGGGGRGGGGQAANFDEDEVIEQQRLVQLAIQRCMLDQGFEYVPEDVGDGLQFFLASQRSSASPLDYAQTAGFGISTRFDAILEGEFDLSETISPNDDHVATLSEGEADAWEVALSGEPPQRNEQGQLIDPETGEVLQGGRRGQTGGCAFDAQQEVRGDFAQLAELAGEFDELQERIDADPRIAEIALDWQDCMRAEGYDYQDEGEARQAINQDFRPLLRSFFQSRDNDAGGTGNDGQGVGQGAGQGQGGQLARVAGLELTAEQEAELEALQDVERAVAVASLTCQGETADEIEEITLRYESEFVAANRDALEAFAAS